MNGISRLRRAILAFGLGVSFAGLCFAVLFYWRPVGSGPAGPQVPREAFQQPWSTRPVVLFGIGDSVTKGFGAKPGNSYFERLMTNPPDEFEDMKGICLKTVLPNLRSENYAVSGSTSISCLKSQLDGLKPFDPGVFGVVVLTTGGNDIIHNYGRTPPVEGAMYGATIEQAQPWIEAYEERMRMIVAAVEDLFPGGCHIFLANIYDPSDGLGHPEIAGLPKWRDMIKVLNAYNAVIARCVEHHEDKMTLVDMHGLFLGHGVACRWFWNRHYDPKDPHFWYFANIEDPNVRGYDAIRRIFLIRMGETLPGILKPAN